MHCSCFFRVRFVVTCLTKAHQIVVVIRQFRVFIHMFDVMNNDRRHGFSIPCAPPAAVSVTPLYELSFSFPFLAVVIKIHCRTFNEYGPPRRADGRKSFMLCELLRAGAGVFGSSCRPHAGCICMVALEVAPSCTWVLSAPAETSFALNSAWAKPSSRGRLWHIKQHRPRLRIHGRCCK